MYVTYCTKCAIRLGSKLVYTYVHVHIYTVLALVCNCVIRLCSKLVYMYMYMYVCIQY